MNKLLNFLSFRGRVNRARFWLTAIAIYAVMVVSSVVAAGLAGVFPVLAVLFLPLFMAAFVASLANAARRLHDRGKSAWWLLIFVGLPTLFLVPAEIAQSSSEPGGSAFAGLCGLVSLPFSIWGFVEMACLKGTAGPNRFGEDALPPAREALA